MTTIHFDQLAIDLMAGMDRTVVLEPGNGSRYVTHLQLGRDEYGDPRLVVTLPDFHAGFAFVTGQTYASPDYVAEKLKLNMGDAEPMSAFITELRERMHQLSDGLGHRPVTIGARVTHSDAAHTRFDLFIGRNPDARGLAGELVMRTDEFQELARAGRWTVT